MASNKLKALKSLVKALEKEEKPERKYDPVKQAEGYKERMEGSGVDVEKVTDTRNPLEKALNLKQDQNVLFDIFEVIGRPQQALFGAINAAQKDENILEGAKQGIAGEKETPFGEILREGGMDDAPIFGEDSGFLNQLGWDDIFGFAGDVLLDPIDIPLFGASKFAKIGGKTVKYADALADSAKAVDVSRDAMKSAEVAFKAAEVTQESAKIASAKLSMLKATKEWEKLAKSYTAIATMKRSNRTLLQIGTQYTGTGFKNMFRFADNRFTKLLEKIDAKSLEKSISSNAGKVLKQAPKEIGALKFYTDIKKGIESVFDWSRSLRKRGVDLVGESAKIRGAQDNLITAFEATYGVYLEDTNAYRALFIESAKKNGIYDKLYESARKGRSIEEIGKQVYPHLKTSAEVSQAMVEDHIDEIMMVIYEHGADMFGVVDGETVANIRGLSQQTSIYAAFRDDSLMFRMGITEDMKNAFEEWTKTYAPEWYSKYVTDEVGMFVQYEGTDSIQNVWRFNEGVSNEGVGEKLSSLRREMDRVKTISEASIDDFENILNDYDTVLKEIEDAQDVIANNAARKKLNQPVSEADKLYALPGTPVRKTIKGMESQIASKQAELLNLQEAMSSVTGKGSRAKIKKIAADAEVLSKEVDALYESIDKLKLDNFAKDGSSAVVDVHTHLSELKNRAAAHTSQVTNPLSGLKTGRPVRTVEEYQGAMQGAKTMNDAMTIPVYLNDNTVNYITEFANLEGTAQYLSATHHFMNSAVSSINDILDTNMSFQDGYMAHVMNDSWGKLNFPQYETLGKRSPFLGSNYIGNTRKLATRKYQTSALAANDLVKGYAQFLVDTGSVTKEVAESLLDSKNVEMFSTNLRTSVADFMRKAPENAADAKMFRTVLSETLQGQLKGAELIIPASKMTSKKTPRGFTQTSRQAVMDKLNAMSGIISEDDNKEIVSAIQNWLKDTVADSDIFYIDNNINRLIGRIGDSKETSRFVQVLEFVNNVFKKNKLLSPGFQMRNISGNFANMNLAGMSMKDVFNYTKNSMDTLKKGDVLFARAAREGIHTLSPKELQLLENYNEFARHGFQQMGNRIQDIPDHIRNINKKQYKHGADPRRMYNALISFNFNMNERQDTVYRMAAYMWAKDNAGKVMEMGFEKPEQFVRFALFDFSDLSHVENEVFKKIIPFYTFTKKNLGFQMKNMMQNPNRYNRLTKAFDSMWGMLDLSPEELDAYMVENYWIPIPNIDKDGKYFAIKASLPLGDLGEWASDPFRRLMASSTPLVRAPFEIATNTQAFSGMPIQEFKGQRGFQIPELSRGVEYGLNQVGLDVPATLGFDIGRTIGGVAQGEVSNPLDALMQGAGRTVMSHKDPALTKRRKAYEELDHLEGLMRYYKQEGIDILTLAELTNREGSNRTKALLNNLQSIIKRG